MEQPASQNAPGAPGRPRWLWAILAAIAAVLLVASGAWGVVFLFIPFFVGYAVNRWGLVPIVVAGSLLFGEVLTEHGQSSCVPGSDCEAGIGVYLGLVIAVFGGADVALGVFARRRRGDRPTSLRRRSS